MAEMIRQYCIWNNKINEIWRGDDGTWSLEKCEEWIEEDSLQGMFSIRTREVTEWVAE